MCIPLGKEFSALDLDGKRHELLFLKASIKPDLCLLTSKKRINKPASKIAKTSMSPGEKAFNLAAPLGIYDSNMLLQFEGYYSGQTQAILGTTVDVYTIPSRPGSSGSPVYNNKWEVVGIISMVNTQIESLALVVPLSDIQEFIKELQEQ